MLFKRFRVKLISNVVQIDHFHASKFVIFINAEESLPTKPIPKLSAARRIVSDESLSLLLIPINSLSSLLFSINYRCFELGFFKSSSRFCVVKAGEHLFGWYELDSENNTSSSTWYAVPNLCY